MPLYNKEQYVFNTIQSVLNQKYEAFELIIVDDGSTDSSGEIVQSIKDRRIRYFKQKNQGVSVARNYGIRQAKYDYIAFLDSDDLWLSDFLETMNKLIEKYPDAGAYGCAYLHEEVKENTLYKAELLPKQNEDKYINNYFEFAFDNEQTLTASTTVIRRIILDHIGYFPVGVNNWEDLDFWTRIGLYYNIVFTKRICAIYNDVSTGASKAISNLHSPVFYYFKMYMQDDRIKKERKHAFLEYVIAHKLYSSYQQYLIDKKGLRAIIKILPYFYTKRYRKIYISMILQFILTPEIFTKLNNKRKK